MYKHDNITNSNNEDEPILPSTHCPHCSSDKDIDSSEYGYAGGESDVSEGTPEHKGEQEYFPDLHEGTDTTDENYAEELEDAEDASYEDSGIGENTDAFDESTQDTSYN